MALLFRTPLSPFPLSHSVTISMKGVSIPVKFCIGTEQELDIKEAPRRLVMEIGSGPTGTCDPVGLRILIHKPGKALCVINKVALRGSICGMNPRNRPAVQQPGFLEACRLCKKKLSPGKDVYMYMGDQAFCSVDCRCEQILLDEINEGEDLMLRRKKRVSSPVRCKAGNRGQESHQRRGIWATG